MIGEKRGEPNLVARTFLTMRKQNPRFCNIFSFSEFPMRPKCFYQILPTFPFFMISHPLKKVIPGVKGKGRTSFPTTWFVGEGAVFSSEGRGPTTRSRKLALCCAFFNRSCSGAAVLRFNWNKSCKLHLSNRAGVQSCGPSRRRKHTLLVNID